jgi:hypothetical protein
MSHPLDAHLQLFVQLSDEQIAEAVNVSVADVAAYRERLATDEALVGEKLIEELGKPRVEPEQAEPPAKPARPMSQKQALAWCRDAADRDALVELVRADDRPLVRVAAAEQLYRLACQAGRSGAPQGNPHASEPDRVPASVRVTVSRLRVRWPDGTQSTERLRAFHSGANAAHLWTNYRNHCERYPAGA